MGKKVESNSKTYVRDLVGATSRISIILPSGQISAVADVAAEGEVITSVGGVVVWAPPAAATLGESGLHNTSGKVRLGGTLLEHAIIISNGTYGVRLGETTDKLYQLIVNTSYRIFLVSDDQIWLHGGIMTKTHYATDTDYTVTDNAHTVVLPPITANRVLTLPAASDGLQLTIVNRNNSGFTWTTPSSIMLKDETYLTTLGNRNTYVLQGLILPNPASSFRVISIY